jgi:hypothetical protein
MNTTHKPVACELIVIIKKNRIVPNKLADTELVKKFLPFKEYEGLSS